MFAAFFITGCLCAVPCAAEEQSQESLTAVVAESVSTTAEAAESIITASEAGSQKAEEPLQDTVIAGWHIVTENVEINPSLENISVALGYSGMQTSEFVKKAEEGNTFCMVKLLIEKEGSKEVIDWEKMILTDAEGNEYHRIQDEFILDLGMKRLPGTKLNFGSNEGWIAFEIPLTSSSGLTLSYDFENESYSCELTQKEETATP